MVTIGSNDLGRPNSADSGYDGRYSGLATRVDESKSTNQDVPSPIQVIKTDEENHTFSLDDHALASILLRPDVASRKVAIISVAGAFRKGKSFLLNFFLRFMHNMEKGEDGWLGDDTSRLEGFSWRGGCERETSGIMLWSEPFFVRLPSGERVALLLMDTQGAFDSQSTVKDCATVFALSTMVSSVQIYNLSQNIQEDDLQHLQLFTEYGRLALESSEAKPFQALTFLVRDWSFPYEAPYGFEGGETVLERRLKVSDKQHHELQQLRRHIRAFFSDINCFLMPHPGLRVATSPDFKGQLRDIEPEFKQQLKVLVPRLLSAESLVLKEINGQKVTGRELMEYFRAYIKIFQGEELPEPKSMLLATAEANNLAAVANAKADYMRNMEEVCGGETPYMTPTQLDAYHEKFRNGAIKLFQETRKMGGDDYSQSFLERLDEELWESYENYVKVNNGKNLFRSARTPAVFFVILVILYILQEIFQMVGMELLAKACGLVMGLIIFVLCFWAYTRYSGTLREAGQAIDEVATGIWENLLSPMSNYAMREGVRQAVNIQQRMNDGNLQRSTSSVSRTSNRSAGSAATRKKRD